MPIGMYLPSCSLIRELKKASVSRKIEKLSVFFKNLKKNPNVEWCHMLLNGNKLELLTVNWTKVYIFQFRIMYACTYLYIALHWH